MLGVEVGLTVLMGGTVTAAGTYLLYQRVMRPAVARALESEPPGKFRVPGVTLRIFLIWALGTAVPVAGIALLAGGALVVGEVTVRELAVAGLVLALVALAAGFTTIMILTRAVADPLRLMREAIRSMEAGDYDVSVPVYDASEIGFLQAGINRMADGLREREFLRDVFGRHVGTDVARRALAQGEVSLGGEEREVGVLFVDVIGSTAFTVEHDPETVVESLNAFFGTVVEVVDAHGGLVNKFEGDAALCVWGAPLAHDDPAGRGPGGGAGAGGAPGAGRGPGRGGRGGRRHRGGGQHRLRGPARVHGDRRPGQPGCAPDRAGQGPRRPRAGDR